MIRTQIQLPDDLYRAAKEIARRKEWSLAEIVRQGVEYIVHCYPKPDPSGKEWTLPGPFDLGIAEDSVSNPDWRTETRLGSGALQLVREKRSKHGRRKK